MARTHAQSSDGHRFVAASPGSADGRARRRDGARIDTTLAALAAASRVNIGTPFESGQPAVAVDSAGDAVVAWANTKDLAGANNFVQYCVLPVGATACSRSGNLSPPIRASTSTASRCSTRGRRSSSWPTSTARPATTPPTTNPSRSGSRRTAERPGSIVNSGLSVTSGIIDADTGPLGAVTVPRDRRARLRLGHRIWPADVQRVPAELASGVLRGDVLPPATPRSSRTPIRTRSATSWALRLPDWAPTQG